MDSITNLSLQDIYVADEPLQHLLSNCPLLKNVTLGIDGYYVHTSGNEYSSIINLFQCLPVVETLSISLGIIQGLPTGEWFCCGDCDKIHTSLGELVAGGEKRLPDTFMGAIKKKHVEQGLEPSAELDIRWRLLSGKIASDDTRVLLSKAVAIFHDRFDPITDSTTSRLDLIPHMVYGRSLKQQDYGGMYCAILTVNSTVVSAGIFRIFGNEVAELPLVATSSECQGLGYFQALFSCIEELLASLNVKILALPAADEVGSIWTKKFGFEKIPDVEDIIEAAGGSFHLVKCQVGQGTDSTSYSELAMCCLQE